MKMTNNMLRWSRCVHILLTMLHGDTWMKRVTYNWPPRPQQTSTNVLKKRKSRIQSYAEGLIPVLKYGTMYIGLRGIFTYRLCFLLRCQWPIGTVCMILPLGPEPIALKLHRDTNLFCDLLLWITSLKRLLQGE